MNVSLTKQLNKFVTDQVKSGLYGSSSEVVRQGLRLMKEEQKLAALRKEINIGLEQAKRGEVIDGDIVFRKLKRRLGQARVK